MNENQRIDIMKTAITLFENGHEIKRIIEALLQLYPEFKVDIPVIGAIEMFKSLILSIDKAGGSGWPTEKLLKMTVMDLLSSLSTNHVRFTFKESK